MEKAHLRSFLLHIFFIIALKMGFNFCFSSLALSNNQQIFKNGTKT